MSVRKRRILFLDRDGTLIIEPEDKQIDSLEKLELVEGVIPVAGIAVNVRWIEQAYLIIMMESFNRNMGQF